MAPLSASPPTALPTAYPHSDAYPAHAYPYACTPYAYTDSGATNTYADLYSRTPYTHPNTHLYACSSHADACSSSPHTHPNTHPDRVCEGYPCFGNAYCHTYRDADPHFHFYRYAHIHSHANGNCKRHPHGNAHLHSHAYRDTYGYALAYPFAHPQGCSTRGNNPSLHVSNADLTASHTDTSAAYPHTHPPARGDGRTDSGASPALYRRWWACRSRLLALAHHPERVARPGTWLFRRSDVRCAGMPCPVIGRSNVLACGNVLPVPWDIPTPYQRMSTW